MKQARLSVPYIFSHDIPCGGPFVAILLYLIGSWEVIPTRLKMETIVLRFPGGGLMYNMVVLVGWRGYDVSSPRRSSSAICGSSAYKDTPWVAGCARRNPHTLPFT